MRDVSRYLCVVLAVCLLAPQAARACTTPTLMQVAPAFAGLHTYSVASADFNGDGNQDLVTPVSADGKVQVHFGNGDGTFQNATINTTYKVADFGTIGIAAGDVNGDGVADIVAASQSVSLLSVLINKGDGTFFPAVQTPAPFPNHVFLADFDGDGRLDALVDGNAATVFFSGDEGTFRSSHTFINSVSAATIGDMNGDGMPDVIATSIREIDPQHAITDLSVFLNLGDTIFDLPVQRQYVEDHGDPTPPLASGDFNGDGKGDIVFVSNFDKGATIFLGAGDGSVTPGQTYIVNYPGFAVAADVTEDGILDLLFAPVNGTFMTILRGLGNGQFVDTSYTWVDGESHHSGLTVADLDNDGRVDIGVSDFHVDRVEILLNRCTPRYAPVTLMSSSNPAQFGNTVSVTATVTPRGTGLPDPTGTVTFKVDNTTFATAPLVSGGGSSSATVNLPQLSPGSHVVEASYGGDANYYGPAIGKLTQVISPPPFGAPLNFTATRSGPGSAQLTWFATAGADSYQVVRRNNNAWVLIQSVSSSTTSVTVPFTKTVEIFGVRAVGDGQFTDYSADVASDMAFSTAIAGHVIHAAEFNELRTAINLFRTEAGLGTFTFTDPTLVGTIIKAIHVNQLRTAMAEARMMIGTASITFSRPVTVGLTIRATDVSEIQAAMQ